MHQKLRRKPVIIRKPHTRHSTQALQSSSLSQPQQAQAPASMSIEGVQDLLSCTICLEKFTETKHRPLMLPACGHTFCNQCLSALIKLKRDAVPFLCPTCRRSQPVKSVEELPANYSLLAVTTVASASAPSSGNKEDSKKDSEKYVKCLDHGCPLAFWCLSCDAAACGECLFEQHPKSTHKLTRLQDHLLGIQKIVTGETLHLVNDLISYSEENNVEIKAALVKLVDQLRRRRILDDLTRKAREARRATKWATDYASISSAQDMIDTIRRKIEEAAITSSDRSPSETSEKCEESVNEQNLVKKPIKIYSQNVKCDTIDELRTVAASTLTMQAPRHISSPASSTATSASSCTASSPTASYLPPWPQELCGVLSDNGTCGRINLEPKGLHVYALQPTQDKCDLFINMDVLSSLTPPESPEVFLDLHDGRSYLGRVYIKLQSHLRRAQNFLALCTGEKGQTYRNSLFHSVIRRNGVGEELVGGDYEGKGGTGGAAILKGIAVKEELAKRCERGMVVRGSTSVETAAQFSIVVRDGARNKTVYPFGRVSKGMSVVEEACKRQAMSVSVQDCGFVLPL